MKSCRKPTHSGQLATWRPTLRWCLPRQQRTPFAEVKVYMHDSYVQFPLNDFRVNCRGQLFMGILFLSRSPLYQPLCLQKPHKASQSWSYVSQWLLTSIYAHLTYLVQSQSWRIWAALGNVLVGLQLVLFQHTFQALHHSCPVVQASVQYVRFAEVMFHILCQFHINHLNGHMLQDQKKHCAWSGFLHLFSMK